MLDSWRQPVCSRSAPSYPHEYLSDETAIEKLVADVVRDVEKEEEGGEDEDDGDGRFVVGEGGGGAHRVGACLPRTEDVLLCESLILRYEDVHIRDGDDI